jgi:tetratricopeptide (TPR) repeat protein
MRAPLTPIKAFVQDAAQRGAAGDHSSADDPRMSHWLLVAQAAERLAELRPAQRAEYLTRLGDSVLPERLERPTQIEGDGRVPADATAELAERLRLEAEDMEREGCFELALTTVSSVCKMLARGSLTARLLATAHLGRIVRQTGELDSAVDCYTSVTQTGLSVDDGPVAAHGYIGLGNVAHARGNRPSQKAFFQKALELAPKGSPVELSAHQGLMVTANQQGELADALIHGWKVHDLAMPDSEVQFETLNNLAQTALYSGFARASLSGFEYVIQRARISRIRLPAIGGAAIAAARLKDRSSLAHFELLARDEINRAALPHESARMYYDAAEARAAMGDFSEVLSHVADCLRISDAFGFHELRVKAELLRDAPSTQQLAKVEQGAVSHSSDIILGIERLSQLQFA